MVGSTCPPSWSTSATTDITAGFPPSCQSYMHHVCSYHPQPPTSASFSVEQLVDRAGHWRHCGQRVKHQVPHALANVSRSSPIRTLEGACNPKTVDNIQRVCFDSIECKCWQLRQQAQDENAWLRLENRVVFLLLFLCTENGACAPGNLNLSMIQPMRMLHQTSAILNCVRDPWPWSTPLGIDLQTGRTLEMPVIILHVNRSRLCHADG